MATELDVMDRGAEAGLLLRRKARGAAFAFLRWSGLPLLVRKTVQRNRTTILLYHSVKADVLDVHLKALRRHYRLISLRDYVAERALGRGDGSSLPALVITLDDGLKSHYELLEVFRRHHVIPTSFVCSGVLKCRQSENWDVKPRLSLHEFTEMRDTFDFQGHSESHAFLTRCTDERAWTEIDRDRRSLQRDFDLDVYALAYPSGDYGRREVEYAARAGYSCALTTRLGFNNLTTNPFELRRIDIPNDSGANEVLVRAAGVASYLKLAATGRWSFGGTDRT